MLKLAYYFVQLFRDKSNIWNSVSAKDGSDGWNITCETYLQRNVTTENTCEELFGEGIILQYNSRGVFLKEVLRAKSEKSMASWNRIKRADYM